MKAYVAKKVLSLPLIIFGVSISVFIAIRALPGDFFSRAAVCTIPYSTA